MIVENDHVSYKVEFLRAFKRWFEALTQLNHSTTAHKTGNKAEIHNNS